jgi:hypothetical protein
MDELLWGQDHENVNNWVEWLTMAAKVWNLNVKKLFKIAKLNLKGWAKEWIKKLNPTLTHGTELSIFKIQKYGDVDTNDIRMKFDAIK